ncbi:MAG TPA: sce7726 family protein [Candidatus Saccharimonadales bacterium]|nr:sce7726 family protein [Candidatus Saccharimonadales bacterium]
MEDRHKHYFLDSDMHYHKTKMPQFDTKDYEIRQELVSRLEIAYKDDPEHMIVEELGINHGSVRADVAVINGIMDCYEIKSDRDTLLRLPEQIRAYNSVFDKVTLVVGFTHLYEALEMIPDWWGVTLAKTDKQGILTLNNIRESSYNTNKDKDAVARLLWREEALRILTEKQQDNGVRSKPKAVIYERLTSILEIEELSFIVRQSLRSRPMWRSA